MSLFESETLNSPEIQNANTQTQTKHTQTYSNSLRLTQEPWRFFGDQSSHLVQQKWQQHWGLATAMSTAKHGTECVRVRDDSMDNLVATLVIYRSSTTI